MVSLTIGLGSSETVVIWLAHIDKACKIDIGLCADSMYDTQKQYMGFALTADLS